MSITTPPAVRTVDPSLFGMHFSVVSTNPQKTQEIFAHAHLTLAEMKKRTYLNFFICKEDPQLAITGTPHPGRQMLKEQTAEACGLTTWIGSALEAEEDKKAFSKRRREVEKVSIKLEFLETPDFANEAINAFLVEQVESLCANVFPHIKKAGVENSSQVLTGEFFD